ncbi:MAG: nuclear transport factor 2 family protein [Pseudomonadales bacterium]
MSISVLHQARKHPARDAAIGSITCAQNKDREGWLALWAEDGVIEDPVGPSPLDPEGKGHRGREALTNFYDTIIAPGDLRFCIRQTFACGDECANVGTITTRSSDGTVGRTELVMVYRVNEDGKVISLRAFWEFDDTIASMF